LCWTDWDAFEGWMPISNGKQYAFEWSLYIFAVLFTYCWQFFLQAKWSKFLILCWPYSVTMWTGRMFFSIIQTIDIRIFSLDSSSALCWYLKAMSVCDPIKSCLFFLPTLSMITFHSWVNNWFSDFYWSFQQYMYRWRWCTQE
jgi:hypothetical protein